jgi:hypothetical protein
MSTYRPEDVGPCESAEGGQEAVSTRQEQGAQGVPCRASADDPGRAQPDGSTRYGRDLEDPRAVHLSGGAPGRPRRLSHGTPGASARRRPRPRCTRAQRSHPMHQPIPPSATDDRQRVGRSAPPPGAGTAERPTRPEPSADRPDPRLAMDDPSGASAVDAARTASTTGLAVRGTAATGPHGLDRTATDPTPIPPQLQPSQPSPSVSTLTSVSSGSSVQARP